MKTAITVVATIVALLLALILSNLFAPDRPAPSVNQQAYSDFVHDVQAGDVQRVLIQGSVLTSWKTDGTRSQTYLAGDPALVPQLMAKGVHLTARPVEEDAPSVVRYLLNWLPFLVFTGTFVWMAARISRLLGPVEAAVRALQATLAERPRP